MKIALFSPVDTELNAVRDPLLAAGHDCVICADEPAMLEILRDGSVELLIIDATAGADVRRWLDSARAAAGGVLPILLLVDDADVLLDGMEAGGGDFLVKPVRQRDLLTRVRVLLHRAWPEKRERSQLRFGRIVFDLLASRVTLAGRPVALTQKEFALALLLFRHLNQPVSRATLQEALWPQETGETSRTVDTHVSRVRIKLGLQAGSGYRLSTVYGYGYLLKTG